MSLIGDLAGGYALLFGGGARSIGGIIPDCTLEELHRDGLVITQHPVEKGAAVTDHAFLRPAEVDMRIGFSNSTAGDVGYARSVYQSLLALQRKRQPFDVATGKRLYQRMLIAEIGVTTEARSENILLCSVRLQQITITSTQMTSSGAQTGTGTETASPNTSESQQANPASTAPVTDRGEQQATPVPSTEFAGAYNPGAGPAVGPGAYALDGSPQGNGSFGLGGISAPDGVSPPATGSVDIGDIQIETPPSAFADPSGGNGVPSNENGGVVVSPYNPFGA